jgi:TolA-binding protein
LPSLCARCSSWPRASPSFPRVSLSGPGGAVDSTVPFTSPQLLFENAYGDYAAGTYLLAVKGFESYLQYFPNSASAAAAQLYIGQSHEGASNYKEALAAYDTVIANYPTSSETPVAYYKRAGVLERLGNSGDARQSYETLQKLFPESDAAVRAKQALERLSKPR